MGIEFKTIFFLFLGWKTSAERVGFILTPIAGNDGVSLESAKWAEVLWQDKHQLLV